MGFILMLHITCANTNTFPRTLLDEGNTNTSCMSDSDPTRLLYSPGKWPGESYRYYSNVQSMWVSTIFICFVEKCNGYIYILGLCKN